MTPLTPREHQALRDLAPTREVYGKAPLPIEILAAGGPRALLAFDVGRGQGSHERVADSGSPPERSRDERPVLAERPKLLREWLTAQNGGSK